MISACLATAFLVGGCADACSEAESLCEDCSVEGEDCAAAFANASNEFCEDAVKTYEASCPDG